MFMFLLDKTYWEVRETMGRGKGIFSKKIIKKGTVIGDYLGKVIKISEYDLEQDKKGLYLMYLNDEAAVYPNLRSKDIHLFNHSCKPNCWIINYKGHVLFFALRKIDVGEELTISYLLSPNEGACNPCTHICKCQSKKCTGTMHLTKSKFIKWQRFQDRHVKTKKTYKFRFNKNLPKLNKYPTKILVDPIYSEMVL